MSPFKFPSPEDGRRRLPAMNESGEVNAITSLIIASQS